MKKRHYVSGCTAISIVMVTFLSAHPHLQKSVTAKVGEIEATVSFSTAPSNEEHVRNAKVGAFSHGSGRLTLSGELNTGSTRLPAGEYTVGAIKNGENDWTMALYPGRIRRGDSPDMSQVIKLQSWLSNSEGSTAHIYFDIAPGHGPMEGKVTLVWHFGSLYLAGALA